MCQLYEQPYDDAHGREYDFSYLGRKALILDCWIPGRNLRMNNRWKK